MGISKDKIKHLADLSGLSLSDDEVESLGQDLTAVIGYFDQLNELDTTQVEPTFQVYEMENVWRPDEITSFEADRAALLALAPATQEQQIKVPKVL